MLRSSGSTAAQITQCDTAMQVLNDAKAVDDAYEAGHNVEPLCGMAFVVKDNIDVLGYASGTALIFIRLLCTHMLQNLSRG